MLLRLWCLLNRIKLTLLRLWCYEILLNICYWDFMVFLNNVKHVTEIMVLKISFKHGTETMVLVHSIKYVTDTMVLLCSIKLMIAVLMLEKHLPRPENVWQMLCWCVLKKRKPSGWDKYQYILQRWLHLSHCPSVQHVSQSQSYLLHQEGLCFCQCWFVCLSVSNITQKSYEQILMKNFRLALGIIWIPSGSTYIFSGLYIIVRKGHFKHLRM